MNIVGDFVLTYLIGFGGLALSTSIASIFVMAVDYLLLKRRLPWILESLNFVEVLKLLATTIAVSSFAYYSFKFVGEYVNSSLSLITTIALMCILYIGILYTLKSPVVQGLNGLIAKLKSR